jgi:hypothetical protein
MPSVSVAKASRARTWAVEYRAMGSAMGRLY